MGRFRASIKDPSIGGFCNDSLMAGGGKGGGGGGGGGTPGFHLLLADEITHRLTSTPPAPCDSDSWGFFARCFQYSVMRDPPPGGRRCLEPPSGQGGTAVSSTDASISDSFLGMLGSIIQRYIFIQFNSNFSKIYVCLYSGLLGSWSHGSESR